MPINIKINNDRLYNALSSLNSLLFFFKAEKRHVNIILMQIGNCVEQIACEPFKL